MTGAFDAVVVGAGSAGAVLAARLSEDTGRTVMLLEAGPDHRAAAAPPGVRSANFFAAFGEPGRIWPDLLATRASGQPPAIYVRGRGAGGSSSLNALGAIRGLPDDYDRWETDLGCAGWGWAELRDAFLRIEDDIDHGGDGSHGHGGPLPLWRQPLDALAPFDVAMRDALTALGHPVCDDYHAPEATGVSRWALTVRDNRRVSTNDAYLEPARDRVNLTVRGDTLVDRVLLDATRAVGVRTAAGDEIAAREVFVCAGAIHSPAILLRSGIGVDDALPVGQNLRDHATTPGFEVALKPAGRRRLVDAPVMSSLLRYSSGLADAGANDMQIVWFNAIGATDDALAGARIFGAVMRVFSHGSVRLRSTDPLDQPVVSFDMLSDRRDLVRLRDAVRRVIEVVEHPRLASIVDGVHALGTPLGALGTDDAIDGWLATTVNDYVHAGGTCRMGRPDDPRAVVDTDCRVIGHDALHVCDASVMPDLPKANTHLTTVAIAERLAAKLAARGAALDG